MSEELKAKLAAVFGVSPWRVSVQDHGTHVEASIGGENPEDGEGVAFTFSQMMQLPAIFGTEHLDFGTEAGHSVGSSWTGEYGHYNNLVIKARRSET